MEEQRKEKGKSAASIFYVRPIKFICNFVFISTEEEIRVEERRERTENGTELVECHYKFTIVLGRLCA